MNIRRERLFMSKNELQSSGKHRRCDFANGAGELKNATFRMARVNGQLFCYFNVSAGLTSLPGL